MSLHLELERLVTEKRKDPRYRKYTKTDALIDLLYDGLTARRLTQAMKEPGEVSRLKSAYNTGRFIEWAEEVAKEDPYILQALKQALDEANGNGGRGSK